MAITATIIFSDGPYKHRIFQLTSPTTAPPEEVIVTDGGNTVEDAKTRKIIGHYVGMYDPNVDGPLPNPEDLPPC